jgi:hypothetical protein
MGVFRGGLNKFKACVSVSQLLCAAAFDWELKTVRADARHSAAVDLGFEIRA